MSNCGLPDGMVHQHVERCYQAGAREGWIAGYEAALEEMAELEDRNADQ